MKPEEFRTAMEKIKPTKEQKNAVFERILEQKSEKRPASPSWRTAFAAACAAVFVFAAVGGVFLFRGKHPEVLSPEYSDLSLESSCAIEVAQMEFGFWLGERNYRRAAQKQIEKFGLSAVLKKEEIGEKLAEVTEAEDPSLEGAEVFSYKPAGCEAVVVLKTGEGYERYSFSNFKSYEENRDEDARAYLQLYGIESEEDLLRVEILRFQTSSAEGQEVEYANQQMSFCAELKEPDECRAFYDYYAALRESSEDYFKALQDPAYFKELPPEESLSSTLSSKSEVNYSAGWSGTGALDDSVLLRIYNRRGVFYETWYYPHIGFLSRYKLPQEFRAFLEDYLH